MDIDIVCPVYNGEKYIDGLLDGLERQENIRILNAVFPVTQTPGCEKVIQKIAARGYKYFTVSADEFSHSLTRERAVLEYCTGDIVLMLSQDVKLINPDSVYLLCRCVNGQVAYAYGRQVCTKKTIEHYIRQTNYGGQSFTLSGEDIARLQLKAFFSSDAFAAYYRPTFVETGGYDSIPMMMNEDMYYSKKILERGYKKAYAAEAVVEHSHKLTLKQLYKRYYASGVWFSEHKEFSAYKETNSGKALAARVFKAALKDFNLPVLLRFFPDFCARYIGLKRGKKGK